MIQDNFQELKRLFDAECAYVPSSYVLSRLLDGQPINEAKRNLIEAIKMIEESRVSAADIQSSSSGTG